MARDIENMAKMGMLIGKISRVAVVIFLIIQLAFLIGFIAILVISSDDCGVGSLRIAMILMVVIGFICLIWAVVNSIPSVKMTLVMKCGMMKSLIYIQLFLSILYLAMIIYLSIEAFGDSDCSDDFSEGYILSLVFLIYSYFMIVVTIVIIILSLKFASSMKAKFMGGNWS